MQRTRVGMRDTALNYPCSFELGFFDGTDNGTLCESLHRESLTHLVVDGYLDMCYGTIRNVNYDRNCPIVF